MRPSSFNQPRRGDQSPRSFDRTPVLLVVLGLVGMLFVGRLFYLQIIKHESYHTAALAEQFKKFSIPAQRGSIYLMNGDDSEAAVLNDTSYLLYADPSYVKDAAATAAKLQPRIDGSVSDIEKKLKEESRYVVLAKKLDKGVRQKIENMELSGIVTSAVPIRIYPDGALAASVLGFVNDDGQGQYGVEGYLNNKLAGTSGLLKAITDVRGVPLAGNADNVIKQPTNGEDVLLTIDSQLQRLVEPLLKSSVEATKSSSGSVVIMDACSGAVKSIANYPTYDPAKYSDVKDQNVFKDRAVTDAFEVGSIVKTLIVSAAINENLITKDTTYTDSGYADVDGIKIQNALSLPAGSYSIFDILRYSMNTGAVHLLKTMGGGEINQQARQMWYDYLTDHFQMGTPTGIEQTGEAAGIIPDPINGDGRDIQYANMSFGQGMTITPLQMAAAEVSILNGGTYYQPRLIEATKSGDQDWQTVAPKVVKSNVISGTASASITDLMRQYIVANDSNMVRAGYIIGGKTGTAQVPDGKGGYKADVNNGTFAGFVGGAKPQYVIIVSLIEPRISGLAGSDAARPLFNNIVSGMLNKLTIAPAAN